VSTPLTLVIRKIFAPALEVLQGEAADAQSTRRRYLIAALTEMLRALQQTVLVVDSEVGALLLQLLVEQGSYYQVHQFVQYNVVPDSAALVAQLLEMETDYPPAAALAVDILRRLGPAANHTIVERLLRRGELLTACRFIRQQGLLSYPARPLLQAAAACPDPQTFAHVFGFLMQRNEVWRGSAAFLPEEGCDDYVRRYMGSFGRYMSEGGFVAEPCTAHADPSQFDVGEPSAAAVTAPAVPESSTALRQEIERMREEEAHCVKARDWLGAERAKENIAALAAQLGAAPPTAASTLQEGSDIRGQKSC